ncbi:hypothetical protein MTP99_006293 [Tenebrio molitor]|nr:hypothetical protein MTP99_006293 [Tenebrio molitor]
MADVRVTFDRYEARGSSGGCVPYFTRTWTLRRVRFSVVQRRDDTRCVGTDKMGVDPTRGWGRGRSSPERGDDTKRRRKCDGYRKIKSI